MADPEKKVLERVVKLMVQMREAQARQYEIAEEIQAVLGGGPSTSDNLKRLEEHFNLLWQQRYGQPYVWNFVKDRAQHKRLLRHLAVEEIETRMLNYIKNDDVFYSKGRHPFLLFAASVNSHASPASRAPEPPYACPHVPDCGNRVTCAIVSGWPRERQVFKGEPVL